jgi:hypothetical protein
MRNGGSSIDNFVFRHAANPLAHSSLGCFLKDNISLPAAIAPLRFPLQLPLQLAPIQLDG